MRERFKVVLILTLVLLAFANCSRMRRIQANSQNVPKAEAGQELKDIHFAFDRYDLSPTAKAILKENAKWLKEHPNVKIEVEGHCDERGTNEYNMALGMKRAKAAQQYLISLGISPDRLRVVSYGEELPLDPRHNEEAWAKNRRAHFKILNK
ncbi:MAG: peptidoglycan-associated lipoprotein Pal [Candidatus Dadabacteria bacterium]|nr:MAG: peptidoglycan-associated lipoprotein Pal [Candidatus Dadabacteria bacterium]